MAGLNGQALIARLPTVRGRMEPDAALADLIWFRAGGAAEVLFTPLDEADLADFLRRTPEEIPVYVIGVGSNLLVRDGGVAGVVIRLGRGFSDIRVEDETRIRVGAAVLDVRVAQQENCFPMIASGSGHSRVLLQQDRWYTDEVRM